MVKKLFIYKVSTPDGQAALVEAANQQGAIKHVVGQYFSATIPTQQELIALVQAGTPIEKAGEAPSGQQELAPTEG